MTVLVDADACPVNWIIVVFMFVSSVNFTLLFLAGTRRWSCG